MAFSKNINQVFELRYINALLYLCVKPLSISCAKRLQKKFHILFNIIIEVEKLL